MAFPKIGTNSIFDALALFVGAVIVRFGWEFGGWIVNRLF